MLTLCTLSHTAEIALREIAGLTAGEPLAGAEVEFKELPYFLVSRSRMTWDFEKQGDINAVRLDRITDRGLLINPEPESACPRVTLIPWTNVISLTVARQRAEG